MEMRLSIVCILVICLVALATGIERTGCGTTKACYSDPEHCNPATDQCSFFLSFKENAADNTKIDFELVGDRSTTNGKGWVGVAFSYDKMMGNDSGIMCINDAAFSYRTFYNVLTVNILDPTPIGLSDTSNSVNNGIISCSFTRAKTAANEANFFDLSKSMGYYLMMGTGPCNSGACLEHEHLPKVSVSKVDLNSTDDIVGGDSDHHSSEETNHAPSGVMHMTALVAVMALTAVLGLLQ